MTHVEFDSASPFEFYHILNTSERANLLTQRVTGTFYRGKQSSGEVVAPACVVQLHGSNGFQPHHHEHMRLWVSNGFDVLQVNSFVSRGVTSTAERQIDCTMASICFDAFCALRYLRCTKGQLRTCVAGWSLGGGAATYAALRPIVEAMMGRDGRGFDSHVAFYPGLTVRPVSSTAPFVWWTKRPIKIFEGGADDYTPPSLILEQCELFREQGADVDVQIFPGGHHSFDRVDAPVQFYPRVRACGGRWTVDLDPSGQMSITGLSSMSYNTKSDRLKHGRLISKRGAHMGGHREEGERSFRACLEFLRRTLFERHAKL